MTEDARRSALNPVYLTDEQQGVVESAAPELVVNAYAGTGKTTTLRAYAAARPQQRMTLKILRDNSDRRPSETRRPIASFVLRNSLSSVVPLAAVFTAFFLAVMVVEGESRPTSQAHRQDGARKVKRTQSPP